MNQPTFIDLFAGIGGMRLAFEAEAFHCIFSSEWDKFAAQSYEANFGEHPHGDIRAIDPSKIPDFDLLVAGFPCQPFSISGVSKKNALGRPHGFRDETQGTLFFDLARILEEKRPRAFLLENVKNLLSHDRGRTMQVILKTLTEELGYTVHHRVLNANRLVPQNRERIFIVGFKTASDAERFRFPEPFSFKPQSSLLGEGVRDRVHAEGERLPRLSDILERRVDPRYHLTDRLWNYLQEYREKHRLAGNGFGFGLATPSGQARTLSARYYKDGSEILIPVRGKNPRRLTPRECARLMGFPDSFKIVVSDTQAYRQFGNSVAVPLVRLVAASIREALYGTGEKKAKKQAQNRTEKSPRKRSTRRTA